MIARLNCASPSPAAVTHVDPANGFRAVLRRPTTRLDLDQQRRWSAAISRLRLPLATARPRRPRPCRRREVVICRSSSRRRTRRQRLSAAAAASAKLQNRRGLRMTIGGQSRRRSGRTLERHERRESGGPAHAEPHLARAPRLQPSSRRSSRLADQTQQPRPAKLHPRRPSAVAAAAAAVVAAPPASRPGHRRGQRRTLAAEAAGERRLTDTTSRPALLPNTGTAGVLKLRDAPGLVLTLAPPALTLHAGR